MIWLILLIFIVVLVVFVMHFRRQAKAREAASAERMKAFLDQARAGTATNEESAAPAATAVAPARETRPQAVQNISGITLRAPLLDAQQAAAYRQLKNALADHEVLARISLATFVAPGNDVTGFARDAAVRRLTDTVVDFLVCTHAMTPLAVVQCGARTGKAAEAAAYAQGCAASLGVRWIDLPPQAPSAYADQPAALRQRVLGT